MDCQREDLFNFDFPAYLQDQVGVQINPLRSVYPPAVGLLLALSDRMRHGAALLGSSFISIAGAAQ